jgi:hypothetical protein
MVRIMDKETWGRTKKAWASQWASMRNEFLQGKVLDAFLVEVDGGIRWECPVCGELGKTLKSKKLAMNAGRVHAKTHISDEDYAALEDLKVLNMPEVLLTRYQRARRDELLERDEN